MWFLKHEMGAIDENTQKGVETPGVFGTMSWGTVTTHHHTHKGYKGGERGVVRGEVAAAVYMDQRQGLCLQLPVAGHDCWPANTLVAVASCTCLHARVKKIFVSFWHASPLQRARAPPPTATTSLSSNTTPCKCT